MMICVSDWRILARLRDKACPVAAVGLAAGDPQSWLERRVVAAQIVLEIDRLGRPDSPVPNRQDMRGYLPCRIYPMPMSLGA